FDLLLADAEAALDKPGLPDRIRKNRPRPGADLGGEGVVGPHTPGESADKPVCRDYRSHKSGRMACEENGGHHHRDPELPHLPREMICPEVRSEDMYQVDLGFPELFPRIEERHIHTGFLETPFHL